MRRLVGIFIVILIMIGVLVISSPSWGAHKIDSTEIELNNSTIVMISNNDKDMKTLLTLAETNFTLILHEGWNLISIPLNLSETNKTLSNALKPINNSYDIVQYYDAFDNSDHWKLYASDKPGYMNDLLSINHTMGLWIHINKTEGAVLNVTGYYPGIIEIPLKRGWNLVGYPSNNTTKTIGDVKNEIEYCDTIQGYDASATYHLKDMRDDESLYPSHGYWVHVIDDSTWTINWAAPASVQKYAVIVGISDYKNVGSSGDLSYCDEDATDWYNYLHGLGYTCWVYGDGPGIGGDGPSTYPRYDGNATEYNVKQAITNMVNIADSDDIIVFTCAGHGNSDTHGCYLNMWDYGAGEDGENGMFYNQELKPLFAPAIADRIFIFLDTCRSGGMNGVMDNSNSQHVYLVTACEADGIALDDDKHQNGGWTYYFLEEGLIYGNSNHEDLEGNFQWANATYYYPDGTPIEFDGDTSKLFYLT